MHSNCKCGQNITHTTCDVDRFGECKVANLLYQHVECLHGCRLHTRALGTGSCPGGGTCPGTTWSCSRWRTGGGSTAPAAGARARRC